MYRTYMTDDSFKLYAVAPHAEMLTIPAPTIFTYFGHSTQHYQVYETHTLLMGRNTCSFIYHAYRM